MSIPEEKRIEVTYKFYLPDHESDLKLMQRASEYHRLLDDIHNECRRVWKYDDKASEELVEFAHKISGMTIVDDV